MILKQLVFKANLLTIILIRSVVKLLRKTRLSMGSGGNNFTLRREQQHIDDMTVVKK